ncbi:hypothetical protein RND71_044207 [Anisodus tanguticus]|uniref:Domain X domain-containing protein n=1 Tax=Anisodus tanguticus TaxID=243964 RepID=A0AAE1QR43_9SOLA|nr:hypothetical protein RND71_044207 [Anisodus tanguticus]
MKEAIRMVLESIYDLEFPDTSHFRSGRGFHSVLRRIKEEWGTSRWFLEFDIRKCFHTIDRHRLIPIFKEEIDDPKFFYPIQKVFSAGRLVGGEKGPYSVPHSVLLSALPGNIYLHKLDQEIGRIRQKYEIPIVQRIRSVLLRTGRIDDQEKSSEEASFNAPQDNRAIIAAGEGGGHWARSISSEFPIQIEAPIKKILRRLRDRGLISRRRPWPIHVACLTNVSDGDIVNWSAGIAISPLSYYRCCDNLYQVRTIVDHQIRWSAIFTPAHKHKSSARNIILKYSKDSNIVNQEGGKTLAEFPNSIELGKLGSGQDPNNNEHSTTSKKGEKVDFEKEGGFSSPPTTKTHESGFQRCWAERHDGMKLDYARVALKGELSGTRHKEQQSLLIVPPLGERQEGDMLYVH